MKVCKKCGGTDFYKAKGGTKRPNRLECRPCTLEWQRQYRERNRERLLDYDRWRYHNVRKQQQRDKFLQRKFGISLEDYDELLLSQGGTCAVCDGLNPNGRVLSVDHDHETGAVRGLLCAQCNFAVGNLGDDPKRAMYLALYLRQAGR